MPIRDRESASLVVLQVFPYDDARLVAHAYSLEHGRVGLAARRRQRGGGGTALFQPLYLLEAELERHPRRELMAVASARLSPPYADIPHNRAKSFAALFLAELLAKTLREQQPDPPLFQFVRSSLLAFDALPGAAPAFHLWFVARLAAYLGIYPTYGFTDQAPVPAGQITLAERLDTLASAPLGCLADLDTTRDQRRWMLDTLLAFYQRHLPVGPMLSHAVLREF